MRAEQLTVMTCTHDSITKEVIDRVCHLVHTCFPVGWIDDNGYIENLLVSPGGISVIVADYKEVVGLAHLISQEEALKDEDIKRGDPEASKDDADYYVLVIAVHPSYRRQGVFQQLICGLAKAALENSQKTMVKVAQHVRRSLRLYEKVSAFFPKTLLIRTLENWVGTGESFDYLIVEFCPADYEKAKSLSS